MELKPAVTLRAAFKVTAQGPMPAHAPFQPENWKPAPAEVARLTGVPTGKPTLQAVMFMPQLMPAGTLMMEPPVPGLPTVRTTPPPVGVNFAETDCAAYIVTLQLPTLEQPPPYQPANEDPESAAAVKVSTVPEDRLVAQRAPAEPQLMRPLGELLTLPLPPPIVLTVRLKPKGEKIAVTDWAVFIIRLQLPIPEQAPFQPENREPPPGAAVSVTWVPEE